MNLTKGQNAALGNIIRNSDVFKKKKITMHLRMGEESRATITTIHSLTFIRDRINKGTEEVSVTFQAGLGDYIHGLLPFTETTSATLIIEDEDTVVRKEFYVVYPEDLNNKFNSRIHGSRSLEELNTMDTVTVTVQLTDPVYPLLRSTMISGSYEDDNLLEIMKTIFLNAIDRISLNGKDVVDVLQIAVPNNGTVLNNVVINTNTPLLALPTYLQNHHGLYSGGSTLFLQQGNEQTSLYIFPPYDVGNYQKPVKKLALVHMEEPMMSDIDNSYYQEEDVYYALVTTVDSSNSVESSTTDKPITFNVTDPESMDTEDIVDPNEDVPYHDQKKFMASGKLDDSPIGLNDMVENRGVNPYEAMSMVSVNAGRVVTLMWKFGDPDVLYPGMPVSFLFHDGTDTRSSSGVLLYDYTVYRRYEKGLGINEFYTSTTLSVLLTGTEIGKYK